MRLCGLLALLCRCDTVALMMRWASVTQSNGRYMCSGSHGGGRGMGLVYDLRLPLEFSYVKKAGFHCLPSLTSLA